MFSLELMGKSNYYVFGYDHNFNITCHVILIFILFRFEKLNIFLFLFLQIGMKIWPENPNRIETRTEPNQISPE